MLPVILGLWPLLLLVVLAVLLVTRGRGEAVTIDSVEIYRGPSDAALLAIDALADAGVAAWVEEDDGELASVHIDVEAAEQVPTLLQIPRDEAAATTGAA